MKKKTSKRSMISRLKQIFEDENIESTEENTDAEYVEVKTVDGNILRMEVLALEQSVVEITEDGEIEVEDNTYVLEDGRSLVIEGGVIKEIIEKEETEEGEETEVKFAEITSVYKWTLNVSADKIEVGTEIKEVYEDGSEYSVAAGEYILEDGRTIQVDAESIVILISDKNGDVESVIGNTEDHTGETEIKPETETEETETDETFNDYLTEQLSNMVKELKSIKKEFSILKTENVELKTKVEKFALSPSADHTDTKLNFSKKNEKPKSKLHAMIGK